MNHTIVVRISPRRWAKATLTDVIGGIPSYTVARPVFDNSVEALSVARTERKLSNTRRAKGAGKETRMSGDTQGGGTPDAGAEQEGATTSPTEQATEPTAPAGGESDQQQ